MKPTKTLKEAGFTLIELLIVIAIIGILAAIAIPQFAQYRTRAYDSAALSDIRNLQQSEAAYFSDNQAYGVTTNATLTTAGATTGKVLAGPATSSTVIQAYPSGATAPDANMTIGLSKNVYMQANTDSGATSFTAEAKHKQGDKYYAVDSDATGVYWRKGTVGNSTIAAPTSTAGTIDIPSTFKSL